MPKVFVVDTSLLLHDPNALRSFEDNIVVVPFPVLEELDHHKSRSENGTAFYARQAIRILDEFRKKGPLHRGVATSGGGILLVDNKEYGPNGIALKTDTADNFIISVAYKWNHSKEWLQRQKGKHDVMADIAQRFPFNNVCIVSKDINLRVKAAAFGIAAEDYLRDRAAEDEEQLYSGIARISVEADHFKELGGTLYREKEQGGAPRSEIEKLVQLPHLLPNQCCIFGREDDHYHLAIYKDNGQGTPHFVHVAKPRNTRSQGIEPKNPEQALALALLMDRDIRIVTLSGIAGTGKTLMAGLAGLEQLANVYEQILVYRSNVEIGEPLGFGKGTFKQKFAPWARPIGDIFELLDQGSEKEEVYETKPTDRKPIYGIDALMSQGRIEIDPINFVRGRSFHWKFVIVDETQNFKPGDIKKVVTRVGKGTKIVLTGDVAQIDNLYLDTLTNGLSHVIERMKGQPTFGHITLVKSERSELAQLAAELL